MTNTEADPSSGWPEDIPAAGGPDPDEYVWVGWSEVDREPLVEMPTAYLTYEVVDDEGRAVHLAHGAQMRRIKLKGYIDASIRRIVNRRGARDV